VVDCRYACEKEERKKETIEDHQENFHQEEADGY